MFYFLSFFFISFLFLSCRNFIFSQSVIEETNYENKICSPISLESLNKYIDFEMMNSSLAERIEMNPFPLNNKIRMDLVVRQENPCPFREKVLLKMSRNETINVLIIGGSLTFGMDLEDYKNERWSKGFSESLNSGWYKGYFNVTNYATGGIGVKLWNSKFDEISNFSPDLLITDFTVNDSQEAFTSLPNYYIVFIKLIELLPKKPALLFNLMFALKYSKDKRYHSGIYNYSIPLDNKDRLSSYFRYWTLSDIPRQILDEHKVPSTSFRDLVYPNFLLPPSDLDSIWSDHTHPNKVTHKYIGDHLFNSITYMIKDSTISNKCSEKIMEVKNNFNYCYKNSYIEPSDIDSRIRPVCFNNSTDINMHATNYIESKDSFVMSPMFDEAVNEWKFYADSKNRHGWIFTTNEPNYINEYLENFKKFKIDLLFSDLLVFKSKIISFTVNVKNAIQITFLRSYPSHYCNLIVWIDDDLSNSAVIISHWSSPSSIPEIFTLLFTPINISHELIPHRKEFYDITPGMHTLHMMAIPTKQNQADKLKFKLLGIKTC